MRRNKKSQQPQQQPKRIAMSGKDLLTLVRSVRAQYESLDDRTFRKKPDIRTGKTITEQDFSGQKRINAYWLGDLLYDNDDVGSTVDTCIRLAVGANGGKVQFVDDQAAQAGFDSWKKTCGWYEGEHWHDVLATILRTVKIHGDCLIVCDPDLTDGKVRFWDSDQICPIMSADFDRWQTDQGLANHRQVEGAVISPDGQVIGWFVTSERNRIAVSVEKATFIPASLGRRVHRPRKMTEYRSTPVLIGAADLTNDTRDMIKSEVQAAKNAAEMAIIVESDDETRDLSKLLSGIDGTDLAGEGITVDDLKAEIAAEGKKDTFAAFAGRSAIAKVPPNTKVTELNNANRPAHTIQSWIDSLADSNGKRMGVMSSLSRGRADKSYSAGQIELSISWTSFAEDQKILERQVVDYVMGVLWPGKAYIVHWPSQFEIDPAKAEATLDARLRGGRTSYRDILGPDWKLRLDQIAEEKEYILSKGLTHLSIFSTVAGAQTEKTETTGDEDED